MAEQSLPLTDEEFNRRNKFLRWKKHGMQFVMLMAMGVICAIIYRLQKYEHLSDNTLYIITAVLTCFLLVAGLLYRRFARLINLDMQSHEKIVAVGIVVRSNYFSNNVYPSRIYGRSGQKYITLDIDGRWVTLSGIQLKRLLPDVRQMNRIYLRDRFMVEFTPYGRHIMHLDHL